MHRWARRWEVTITWARPQDSPWHVTRYQTRVDTPAQLRALIEKARADRFVTGMTYPSVREMVGEVPTRCRQGHPIDGGSATRANQEWMRCGCGGHLVYLCKATGCGDRLVDPVLEADCERTTPGGYRRHA